jgi:hypothetical protein
VRLSVIAGRRLTRRSTRTPPAALRPRVGRRLACCIKFTDVRLPKAWPILAVAAVIALGGAAAIRTVVNSGPAAIAHMSDDERALLAKLDTLRKGMSRAEVAAVLGEPDELGPLGLRPKWQVGGNPLNAVVVYFRPDGAHRIAWLSLGRFNYERNL